MSSTRDRIKQELSQIVSQFSIYSTEGPLSDARIVLPSKPGQSPTYIVDLVGPLTAEQKEKLPTESHGHQVQYNFFHPGRDI